MEYTADDIKIISWPEPIRMRPYMYLKALGIEGCIALINEVMECILNDKYSCNATRVEIRLTRHKEIILEYDGLGMPLDISNIDNIPQPTIYRIFMTLCCGELSDDYYSKFGHLAGVGPFFNAACKSLRITSIVNNRSYSLSFYKGCLSSPLAQSSSATSYNCLRFIFDPEVMGKFEMSSIDLIDIAKTNQRKYPNSKVWFGS